ncbi:hypothetical protein GALMADRAFT_889990 [Galerina marginata CBS 339.88]|uniref:Uncharacterized protein n=1 Tax=Galerina marginata (strain CBS 339.88) TaxID=685588 RepID=A0A067SR41_GALM3|nr:hypothetical protein GALMADRAFT_889990 [Galerina marginata CBS 339.88]
MFYRVRCHFMLYFILFTRFLAVGVFVLPPPPHTRFLSGIGNTPHIIYGILLHPVQRRLNLALTTGSAIRRRSP